MGGFQGGWKKKRVENMRENGWEGCLDERGRGDKSGGAQPFSLWVHHNSISPKWGENGGEKEEEYAGQNCPSSSHGQLFVFFYFCLSPIFFFFFAQIKSLQVCTIRSHWFWFWFFFFWIKFCTIDVGSFCLFLFVFFFNILLAFAYFINK